MRRRSRGEHREGHHHKQIDVDGGGKKAKQQCLQQPLPERPGILARFHAVEPQAQPPEDQPLAREGGVHEETVEINRCQHEEDASCKDKPRIGDGVAKEPCGKISHQAEADKPKDPKELEVLGEDVSEELEHEGDEGDGVRVGHGHAPRPEDPVGLSDDRKAPVTAFIQQISQVVLGEIIAGIEPGIIQGIQDPDAVN